VCRQGTLHVCVLEVDALCVLAKGTACVCVCQQWTLHLCAGRGHCVCVCVCWKWTPCVLAKDTACVCAGRGHCMRVCVCVGSGHHRRPNSCLLGLLDCLGQLVAWMHPHEGRLLHSTATGQAVAGPQPRAPGSISTCRHMWWDAQAHALKSGRVRMAHACACGVPPASMMAHACRGHCMPLETLCRARL